MIPGYLEKLKTRIKTELNFSFLLIQLGIKIFPGNMIYSIYQDEKSPSLHIYPETNTFYCFSTKKYGDIINFYMDLFHLKFKEAVFDLYDYLSIQKTKNQKMVKKGRLKIKSRIELKMGENVIFNKLKEILLKKNIKNDEIDIKISRLIIIRRQYLCNKIFKHIEKICLNRKMSDEALKYLTGKSRKLTIQTIKKFRIVELDNPWFYANNLKRYFLKNARIQCGIFNNKNNFIFGRHRILIPYFENGKIVLIRGRKFPDDKNINAKYIGLSGINSKRIFNVDVLKNMKKGDRLYMCEGEFDTMIADQAGLNAIGFPGVTNIPFNELKNIDIGQYKLYLAFDNDEAGDKAAELFVNELGIKCLRVKLNNTKDLTEAYNGK